jgi:hypothetical protein
MAKPKSYQRLLPTMPTWLGGGTLKPTKNSCLLVHVTPAHASQPLELTPRATVGEERAPMSCGAFPTSPTIVGVCIDLRDSSSAPPQRQIDLNCNALSTRLSFLPPHVFARPLAVSVLPVAAPTSMRRMPKVPPHRPRLSWWPPVMGWMGLVMGLVVVAAGSGLGRAAVVRLGVVQLGKVRAGPMLSLGSVGNAVVPTLAVRLYCDHPAVPCAIRAVYRRHAQRGIFRAGHTVRLVRRCDR